MSLAPMAAGCLPIAAAPGAGAGPRLADPAEARELWQGLVEGSWSVLEGGEAEGKRFLLTRRCPPGVADPGILSARQRSVLAFAAMGHQNKYIAYRLGLAPSTVAAHLRSVCRKLGLGSRRELIGAFAALVGPPATGGDPTAGLPAIAREGAAGHA